jgi:hypothetical protein
MYPRKLTTIANTSFLDLLSKLQLQISTFPRDNGGENVGNAWMVKNSFETTKLYIKNDTAQADVKLNNVPMR